MPQTTQGALSPHQFDALAEFVKSRIGLHLRAEKRALVESRLIKRLSVLRLPDFDAYLDTLRNDPSGAEMNALSQALTTNVTAFFREAHHFERLREWLRSDVSPRLARGEEVRLWSAGCSIGAEPYSIAMVMIEELPSEYVSRVKILATDIDKSVLARARHGEYGARETENLAPDILSRHFTVTATGHVANDPVRNLVQFRGLNLIEAWPMKKLFAAIFCRNVVIYFDAPTQAALWKRFLDQLEPEGHLMIGHSERLDQNALRSVRSVGVTCYQKKKEGATQ